MVSMKLRLLGASSIPRTLEKVKRRTNDEIMAEVHDAAFRGFALTARTKTGFMRARTKVRKVSRGVLIKFPGYARHVSNNYGYSPTPTPTGLRRATQTNRAKPKGAEILEITLEIIEKVIRRAK